MRRILLGAVMAAISMTVNAQTSAPAAGAAPDAKVAPGAPMMTPDQRKAHQEKRASMKNGDCGKSMEEMHSGMSMEEMHAQMHEKMAAKDDRPGAMGSGKGGCGMMNSTKK